MEIHNACKTYSSCLPDGFLDVKVNFSLKYYFSTDGMPKSFAFYKCTKTSNATQQFVNNICYGKCISFPWKSIFFLSAITVSVLYSIIPLLLVSFVSVFYPHLD